MKPIHLAYDLIAIVIFAVLARLAHQTPDMPFGLSGIAETAWPFLLGTLLGWGGLLLLKRPSARLSAGALVWVVTVVFGLGIWSIRHGALPHWSFVVVASVMSGLLLVGWRLGARALRRR